MNSSFVKPSFSKNPEVTGEGSGLGVRRPGLISQLCQILCHGELSKLPITTPF